MATGRPKLNLIGFKVGRLTVIADAPPLRGRPAWLCQCECGKTKVYQGREIHCSTRPPRSCGCGKQKIDPYAGRSHGMSYTKEYNTWRQIKQRCNNPKSPLYEWYGARGITVDPAWLNDFERFFSDMGFAPSPKHTIERENNNLGYSPDNCVWATMKEQAQNRRRPRRKPPPGTS